MDKGSGMVGDNGQARKDAFVHAVWGCGRARMGYADMPLGGQSGMEVTVEWGDGTTAIVYDTK